MGAATIARMAGDAIAKATQDEQNHWAVSFRGYAEKNDPGLRTQLHMYLLNAADAFRGRLPTLTKRLRELCRILDSLPPS
jgi:hypothetical protein